MDVTLSVTVNFKDALLGRARQILGAPLSGERGAAAIKAVRKSVAREFRQLGWSKPGGGVQRWKPVKPFGDKPGGGPPLGGSGGSLARAWAGGRGGFTTTSRDRVSVGITHPGAAVHRGGDGTDAGNRITLIRPKRFGKGGVPLMFWALGLGKGAWISFKKLKKGLEVPSRPHATSNPELVRELERQFLVSLLGGRA